MTRLRQTDPMREASIHIDPNLRATGDSALLRVLMDNLLSNAWKYSGNVSQLWFIIYHL